MEYKNVQICTKYCYPFHKEVIVMFANIIGQINIIKAMNLKPNFSELSREYGIDRRTIKK